jgi:hypothetical protein
MSHSLGGAGTRPRLFQAALPVSEYCIPSTFYGYFENSIQEREAGETGSVKAIQGLASKGDKPKTKAIVKMRSLIPSDLQMKPGSCLP